MLFRSVHYFMKLGADVNGIENPSLNRPLHTAIQSGNWAALSVLLDAGANPNVRNAEGHTPLYLIARNKPPAEMLEAKPFAAARLLVAKGANASIAANDTWTPLHIATAHRYSNMVRLLVELGANINAEATDRDISELTPTLIAEDHNYQELRDFLRAKGGTVNNAFVVKRGLQRALGAVIAPLVVSH